MKNNTENHVIKNSYIGDTKTQSFTKEKKIKNPNLMTLPLWDGR